MVELTRRSLLGGTAALVAAHYVCRDSGLSMPIKKSPAMAPRFVTFEGVYLGKTLLAPAVINISAGMAGKLLYGGKQPCWRMENGVWRSTGT